MLSSHVLLTLDFTNSCAARKSGLSLNVRAGSAMRGPQPKVYPPYGLGELRELVLKEQVKSLHFIT